MKFKYKIIAFNTFDHYIKVKNYAHYEKRKILQLRSRGKHIFSLPLWRV